MVTNEARSDAHRMGYVSSNDHRARSAMAPLVAAKISPAVRSSQLAQLSCLIGRRPKCERCGAAHERASLDPRASVSPILFPERLRRKIS